MSEERAQFKSWCIIELMGHRRLAGLLSEQEIAGHGFLRLDVPGPDGATVATEFYSPASVYGIHPVEERIARAVAVANRPEPVTRWELPAPTPEEDHEQRRQIASSYDDDDDDDLDPVPFG